MRCAWVNLFIYENEIEYKSKSVECKISFKIWFIKFYNSENTLHVSKFIFRYKIKKLESCFQSICLSYASYLEAIMDVQVAQEFRWWAKSNPVNHTDNRIRKGLSRGKKRTIMNDHYLQKEKSLNNISSRTYWKGHQNDGMDEKFLERWPKKHKNSKKIVIHDCEVIN